MSPRPQVSLVVPTHERRASVLRLIDAMAQQTLPPERFEVVVSIDGSTDGTREAIGALSTPFQLRSHWQPNRGRASACNAGVRLSEGDLVVILDDDMVPVPDFLAAHVACHPPGGSVGVLGAVPIAVDETSPAIVRYVAGNFNAHLARLESRGGPTKVREFYSGNFSIGRRTLQRVGGFDESFQEYGNEDVELAIRLRMAGIELLYSAQATAWQRYEKSFVQLARDTVAKGRTAVLCAAKHPELADQMRLGTYREAARRWFAIRAMLLGLSRIVPALPKLMIAFLGAVERRRRAGLGRYYTPALDYCFWAGVRAASSPERAVERRPQREPGEDGSSNAADEPPPLRIG